MSEALVPFEAAIPNQADVPMQPDAPALELVTPEYDNGSGLAQVEASNGVRKWLHRAKRAGQTALVGIEMTPVVNEGLRVAAYGASEVATSGNPIAAGIVAGVSTFAIEAAGGAAGASLLETKQAAWLMDKSAVVSAKMKVPDQLSKPTKLWLTFLGGTNFGMYLEQRENPDRTLAENRRYNWITSAWLGGSLAVLGTLAAEGINVGIDNPQTAGEITAGLATIAGGRALKKRHERAVAIRAKSGEGVDDRYKQFAFGLTTDAEKLQLASELEENVWKAQGFGTLEEYQEHIANSRTFTAFDNEGAAGILRLFSGEHNIPPFMDMHFEDKDTGELYEAKYYNEDEKARIIAGTKDGTIEEVGTLAKRADTPRGRISNRLYRLAYRDARKRGVKQWGIIMEPERVEKMNKKSGFTFRQISETGWYQGGECAAFIMDLEKVDRRMSQRRPLSYHWFVRKSLNR